jgi:hypothetical protein
MCLLLCGRHSGDAALTVLSLGWRLKLYDGVALERQFGSPRHPRPVPEALHIPQNGADGKF